MCWTKLLFSRVIIIILHLSNSVCGPAPLGHPGEYLQLDRFGQTCSVYSSNLIFRFFDFLRVQVLEGCIQTSVEAEFGRLSAEVSSQDPPLGEAAMVCYLCPRL